MNYENLCQICQEESASYRCPKCHIKYCSLKCYRDRLHAKCSKQFDESELIDSMNVDETSHENQTTTNNYVQERITDILKRKLDEKEFHDEQDDEQIEELFEHIIPSKDTNAYREEMGDIDDEENPDGEFEGEERIDSDNEHIPDLPDDIDESDENVTQLWSYLTTEEKREFKSMLSDGRISHLLSEYKPWKPWWLYRTEPPALVTDLEASSTSPSPSLPDTIPATEPNIVPLPSLTSILPHIHVRFDVFEILFAYVFINIRYRGDFASYISESGVELLHIASRHFVQKADISTEEQDPISLLHAQVTLIREHLQDRSVACRISEEFFVNILADVSAIVHGPYPRQAPTNIYVLAALSEVKRFITTMQEYKPSLETRKNSKSNKEETRLVGSVNVFHINRTTKPETTKTTTTISSNSKLCIRPQVTASETLTSVTSKVTINKTPKTFNRKLMLTLARKIDYLLSWTITHSNRLLMLEYELTQVEQDLRHQLAQYQRDKDRIEKNLKTIRLQQQTVHGSSGIQEL